MIQTLGTPRMPKVDEQMVRKLLEDPIISYQYTPLPEEMMLVDQQMMAIRSQINAFMFAHDVVPRILMLGIFISCMALSVFLIFDHDNRWYYLAGVVIGYILYHWPLLAMIGAYSKKGFWVAMDEYMNALREAAPDENSSCEYIGSYNYHLFRFSLWAQEVGLIPKTI